MASQDRRARDHWVSCWCLQRCAKGTDRPRQVVKRTREEHLAEDQAELQEALDRSLEPPPGLARAVRLNQMAIANEDLANSDTSDSSSTSSVRSGSNGAIASPHLDFGPVDFGDDGIEQVNMDEDSPGRQSPIPPSFSSSSRIHNSPLGSFGVGDQQDSTMDGSASESSTSSGQAQSDTSEGDSRTESSGADENEGEGWSSEGDSGEERWLSDSDSESDHVHGESGRQRTASMSSRSSSSSEGQQDRGTHSRFGQDLFEALAGEYQPGSKPTDPPDNLSLEFLVEDLNPSQKATLRHFQTCNKHEATHKMYVEFAKNIEAANPAIKIFPKDQAIKLVKRVTQMKELRWDMCINSCKAFVGPNADLEECDICDEKRFDRKGKARKQYITLPYLPRVRMMYATGTAPTYLAERTIRAQETWFSEDQHRFKDWPEGNLHHQFVQEGMFSDPRHDALMLSADGTKVVEKRNVNAWVILLSSMNSPPGERFRRKETFVSTIIPGPRNPIDMDSFLWPVMEELACAARGFWIWDGGKKEWFLWKAWLVAACADQPGSSKMSKMTGTTGAAACRMCKMKANYLPSKAKQQVGGYYPLRTVGKDLNKRNAQRPDEYGAQDVCSTLLRDVDTYGDNLDRLNSCLTQDTLRKARRDTGLLWQVFTNPVAGDPLQLTDDQQQLFGELVQEA
ncbi:hypothetical protein A4X13_0g8916, partial [Tilletia indica]